MTAARLALIVTLLAVATSAQRESYFACPTTACTESSLMTCAARNEHWASVLYDNVHVCACCHSDNEARLVAGTNVGKGTGLFWGNRHRVCETLALDDVECGQKAARDCNYNALTFRGQFVGCSYCRPACADNRDCSDLGGVCSVNRRRLQPMKSCFYGSLPAQLFPETDSQRFGNRFESFDDQFPPFEESAGLHKRSNGTATRRARPRRTRKPGQRGGRANGQFTAGPF